MGRREFLSNPYHLTVRVESEQTGIEQTLEVCPQRDAVGALIVPACGRRDAMRCIESLGCLLLRDDAAVAVAVENDGPELSLPLPSGGRARLLCTTCSESECLPLTPRRSIAIGMLPLTLPTRAPRP